MPSFESEFDKGTFGQDDYDVIGCTVEYNVSPFEPGVWSYSNGDPGYPPSGGDVEDMKVFDEDGKNITSEVPIKFLEIFYKQCNSDLVNLQNDD